MKVLLGDDAAAARKLETGNPLTILGVQVEANLDGISFVPAPEKLIVRRASIESALRCDRLSGGEAAKLAGNACFSLFRVCVCMYA